MEILKPVLLLGEEDLLKGSCDDHLADSRWACVDVMVVGAHQQLKEVEGVAGGVVVALEIGTERGFLAFVEGVFVFCQESLEVLFVVSEFLFLVFELRLILPNLQSQISKLLIPPLQPMHPPRVPPLILGSLILLGLHILRLLVLQPVEHLLGLLYGVLQNPNLTRQELLVLQYLFVGYRNKRHVRVADFTHALFEAAAEAVEELFEGLPTGQEEDGVLQLERVGVGVQGGQQRFLGVGQLGQGQVAGHRLLQEDEAGLLPDEKGHAAERGERLAEGYWATTKPIQN